MIEAEGKIERRIAEPRAFRIEQHGTVGADENVLRTHVAMDEGRAYRGSTKRERSQPARRRFIPAAIFSRFHLKRGTGDAGGA